LLRLGTFGTAAGDGYGQLAPGPHNLHVTHSLTNYTSLHCVKRNQRVVRTMVVSRVAFSMQVALMPEVMEE
jgi:hypothetical protein